MSNVFNDIYNSIIDGLNNIKESFDKWANDWVGKKGPFNNNNVNFSDPNTWFNAILGFFYTILQMILTFILNVIYMILFYPLILITSGFKALNNYVMTLGWIGGFLSVIIAFLWFLTIIGFFVLLYYIVKFILDIVF